MFNSVLIANRGEIAVRIARTAKRMGLRTIAVYSEADARAAFVREADRAVLIGPAAASDSYLRGDRIIAVAIECGAAHQYLPAWTATAGLNPRWASRQPLSMRPDV